jgi:hypothetical protein
LTVGLLIANGVVLFVLWFLSTTTDNTRRRLQSRDRERLFPELSRSGYGTLAECVTDRDNDTT